MMQGICFHLLFAELVKEQDLSFFLCFLKPFLVNYVLYLVNDLDFHNLYTGILFSYFCYQ